MIICAVGVFIDISVITVAPIAGILMAGATASTTAGATIGAQTFAGTLIKSGVSALSAGAMVHAGATVIDSLPHGSFFHATGGAAGLEIKERMKLIHVGEVVKEVCILPPGVTDGKKSFIRNARRLDNGHYLVAHYGGKRVVEYDENGKSCWEVEVSGGAHSVIRLDNGNTLVAVADADKNPRIMEFDKAGIVVWELSNRDLKGSPLKFLSGMQYLPGVGLLFTNWQGHGVKDKAPHMFLVDRQKNILCTFGLHDSIQTLSSVYVPGTGCFH